jgi:hypothetical protein
MEQYETKCTFGCHISSSITSSTTTSSIEAKHDLCKTSSTSQKHFGRESGQVFEPGPP